MDPGGQEPHHETQAQVGIDPRHCIVGHDAQAADHTPRRKVTTIKAHSIAGERVHQTIRYTRRPAADPNVPGATGA